jgi:hypothetical protein
MVNTANELVELACPADLGNGTDLLTTIYSAGPAAPAAPADYAAVAALAAPAVAVGAGMELASTIYSATAVQ